MRSECIKGFKSLQNNYGVDPKHLTAGGRGEYNLVATNDTPDEKVRNRRTEIIITPKLNQYMDFIDKGNKSDFTNKLEIGISFLMKK